MPPTNAVVSSYPVSGLSDSGSLSSLDSVITVGSFFGFLKVSGVTEHSCYSCNIVDYIIYYVTGTNIILFGEVKRE